MKNINIEEIINNLNNLNIIDIRDSYLYNIGNIPYSINIPMNFIMMNPDNYIDKNKEYYIYCNYGVNSQKLCSFLNNKGYNVININGGYNSYKLYTHKI